MEEPAGSAPPLPTRQATPRPQEPGALARQPTPAPSTLLSALKRQDTPAPETLLAAAAAPPLPTRQATPWSEGSSDAEPLAELAELLEECKLEGSISVERQRALAAALLRGLDGGPDGAIEARMRCELVRDVLKALTAANEELAEELLAARETLAARGARADAARRDSGPGGGFLPPWLASASGTAAAKPCPETVPEPREFERRIREYYAASPPAKVARPSPPAAATGDGDGGGASPPPATPPKQQQPHELVAAALGVLAYLNDSELAEAPPGHDAPALLRLLSRLTKPSALAALGAEHCADVRQLRRELAAFAERDGHAIPTAALQAPGGGGGGGGGERRPCLVAALDSLGYLEERLHAAHGVAPATPEQRGGLHKFNAEDVDPEGGDATADEFLDAFGL